MRQLFRRKPDPNLPATPIQIDNKALYRTLISVVLPITIQGLIGSSLSLVDSLMVGNLGETALASVGAGGQIFNLFWGIMFGFTSASGAFVSQFWGTKDLTNIRRTTGFCLTVCTSVGLLLFLAGMFTPEFVVSIISDIPEVIENGSRYLRIVSPTFLLAGVSMALQMSLRSTQQTKLPLYIGIAAFASNTCLNYLLIFGKLGLPQLGIEGAAWATLIARIVEFSLNIYVIFIRKNIIAGPLKDFMSFGGELVARIIRSGLPVMINETLWAIGQTVYATAYGRMSVTDYASYQAANTIQGLFIMAIFSLADAVMILVGQKLGEGETDYAYVLAKKLLKIGIVCGLVTSALQALCSGLLVGLYNFSPEGELSTLLIILVHSVFMTFSLYAGLIIVGVLRCGGDTRFAMFTEVGCLWLIGIPLVLLGVYVLHWPVYVIVAMAQFSDAVKAMIARKRFYTKKWANTLIRGL
ncbi:MAG: MATE family efflux transporter [Clostridiales bacterium]|nr:MATE family efflux transporter [Clostridiales bacterium]